MLPQASERLVQLSLATLERFARGAEPAAGGSGSSGSGINAGKGGGLAAIASPSVEYAAFAPLVVSTVKVRGALCTQATTPGVAAASSQIMARG